MTSSTVATIKGSARSCTRIEVSEFTYEWDIENFKLLLKENGEAICSPKFRTINTEVEWLLSLYPQGFAQSDAGYVSIYLHLYHLVEKSKLAKTKAYVELSIPRFVETQTLVQTVANTSCYGYARIMQRSALLDLCGSNDSFTIRCKIQVPCEIITTDTAQCLEHVGDTQPGQWSQDFRLLLKESKLSDVVLIVGTQTFPAHKVVLAARSPVFSAMFEHKETQENLKNEVKIENMEAAVVEAMLEFFYTDEVKNLEELAYGLLEAAGKYDIPGLRIMSENALYKALNKENAAEILVLADLHNSTKLKTRVMDFINDHLLDVMQSEGYRKIENVELMKELMLSLAVQRK